MGYARLYKPARTAMQSGRSKTKKWILGFNVCDALFIDSLMKWNGSKDTQNQIQLTFASKEEALDYAHKHQLKIFVEEAYSKKIVPKRYADNFRYNRPL